MSVSRAGLGNGPSCQGRSASLFGRPPHIRPHNPYVTLGGDRLACQVRMSAEFRVLAHPAKNPSPTATGRPLGRSMMHSQSTTSFCPSSTRPSLDSTGSLMFGKMSTLRREGPSAEHARRNYGTTRGDEAVCLDDTSPCLHRGREQSCR